MDNRIQKDKDSALKETIDRAMSRLNTCIPGIIESFDTSNQTAEVSPAIRMRVSIEGEDTQFIDLPKIIQVPLVFPYAATAGFALTLPVKKGDSCLLVFSQRAIDNWHDKGGIQTPEVEGVSGRHHDLTDAFAIMAPAAIPDVLGSWQSDAIELRNKARTSRLTVTDSKVETKVASTSFVVNSDGTIIGTCDSMTVTASTKVTMTTPLVECSANVTIGGNLTVTGLTITGGLSSLGTYGAGIATFSGGLTNTGGDISSDGISLESHTHPQGSDSNGDSQQDTGGPQ